MYVNNPEIKNKIIRALFELICGCLPIVIGIVLLSTGNKTFGGILLAWGILMLFIPLV